jgi:hypothetical protein
MSFFGQTQHLLPALCVQIKHTDPLFCSRTCEFMTIFLISSFLKLILDTDLSFSPYVGVYFECESIPKLVLRQVFTHVRNFVLLRIRLHVRSTCDCNTGLVVVV